MFKHLQVKSLQLNQSANLLSSTKSFETLLNLIENTNNKYKEYLTNKQSLVVFAKDEIQREISKCQHEYDKIASNTVQIVSNNNNVVSLHCARDINDIKQIVENKLVTIKTTKYNHEFVTKFTTKIFNLSI